MNAGPRSPRELDASSDILDERDDDAIKTIYNQHNPVDYDSEEAAHADQVKSFLEDMFDLGLGDSDELESIDEVFERAKEQFREKHEPSERAFEAERKPHRKTRREIEREARAEADAKRIGQSVREIYRKLVSELHPDRETDPLERDRKTELMQRINQAYGKRNLLQLLELQLELEHIDEPYLAGLDPERLRHFNAVLKEQILELMLELKAVEHQFCERFGLFPSNRLDPRTVVRELDYAICSVDITATALPLSGAGKILKRELRKPYWENRERRVS